MRERVCRGTGEKGGEGEGGGEGEARTGEEEGGERAGNSEWKKGT